MNKHYFIELLHKYLKNEATNEEQEFLLSYYNLFQDEPDVLGLLGQASKSELKSQIHNSIWRNISLEKQTEESFDKKVRPIRKWLVRMAAAAILLAICTIGLIFYLRNDSVVTQTVAVKKQQKINRLIRLPDGSTVIVSSGSKLNYPSSFDGLAKREVYLDGEAFFDIKHNANKPFIVHTGKIATTVLGTAFNIKANPDDLDITVTVTRGKVKVSHQNKTLGIILPQQQITCNKQSANSILKRVDTKAYLDWQTQDLLFDDVTVAEAVELLEERFKVDIIFSDELIKSNRFTTTFLKGESLEQVLKSICEFNGADYRYNKERSLITISTREM